VLLLLLRDCCGTETVAGTCSRGLHTWQVRVRTQTPAAAATATARPHSCSAGVPPSPPQVKLRTQPDWLLYQWGQQGRQGYCARSPGGAQHIVILHFDPLRTLHYGSLLRCGHACVLRGRCCGCCCGCCCCCWLQGKSLPGRHPRTHINTHTSRRLSPQAAGEGCKRTATATGRQAPTDVQARSAVAAAQGRELGRGSMRDSTGKRWACGAHV
jgi:hypothetical protein